MVLPVEERCVLWGVIYAGEGWVTLVSGSHYVVFWAGPMGFGLGCKWAFAGPDFLGSKWVEAGLC